MVGEIGLGTWQLGTRWGEPFNEAEAMRILESSYACGINLIDTVWIVDWTDNFWVLVYTSFNVLCNCLTCCCDKVCMKKVLLI